MEVLAFIIALVGLGLAGYLLYSRKSWRANVLRDLAEDEKTIRETLDADVDFIKKITLDLAKKTENLSFGVAKLTKAIPFSNTAILAGSLSRKELNSRDKFVTAVKGLVTDISNKYITINDVSVTTSGVKIKLPFGVYTFSFSKRSVYYKGQSTGIDITSYNKLLVQKP